MEVLTTSTPRYSGNSKGFLETFLVESTKTRPDFFQRAPSGEISQREGCESDLLQQHQQL
jgi:hypothetical protein